MHLLPITDFDLLTTKIVASTTTLPSFGLACDLYRFLLHWLYYMYFKYYTKMAK